MEKDNDKIVSLLGVLVLLGTLFVLITMSQEAVIDECNRTDKYGELVYQDSWVCSNRYGERIVYKEENE